MAGSSSAHPKDVALPIDVALFVTCLTDQFYPRVGIAVTKVLEKLGCRVHFPQAQTCCGQPLFNNGFHDEARDLARRMVAVFENCQYIVTPSGSCCAMVREHFKELLEHDHAYEHAMHHVVANTYEFVEFLNKVLKVDFKSMNLALGEERSITYHYTCHLRGLGETDGAVRLLQQIDRVNFIPLEKTDQCCGFGGTFALKYPAISEAIVQDKIDCIGKTKAQYTVCNDAGCTMNIAGMCNRHSVPTKVVHIAELIAEAMGVGVERL